MRARFWTTVAALGICAFAQFLPLVVQCSTAGVISIVCMIYGAYGLAFHGTTRASIRIRREISPPEASLPRATVLRCDSKTSRTR